MAVPKTTSSSPNSARDLKQRVVTCLNKLADRDTLAGAAAELEAVARDLAPDSLSSFLSCVLPTGDGDPAAVRRHCVRLLAVLSRAHGDALAPFLPKMLAAVVRRLRDPDTAVRSACVDAVAAMAASITRPPFAALLRPLSEAVALEQDHNAQIGSAMCLAAAVEAAPGPEPAQLLKLMPKLLKLVRTEVFKAKPALISLIGSIVGAGGASNRNVLEPLISSLLEHLSSEDWAARKAAAEALGRVAVVERDLAVQLRPTCLASLEARRFDKVKGVRETMNRTLELWKEIPCVLGEDLSPSGTNSPSEDNGREAVRLVDKSSRDACFITPYQYKINPTSRSPSLGDSSATTATPLKRNGKKSSTSMFQKLDCKRSSGWKIEIATPQSPSSIVTREDDVNTSFKVLEPRETRSRNLRAETKRALFSKIPDEKGHKGGLRSGSRVVPINESDNTNLTVPDSSCIERVDGNYKDIEDLSLISKQLVQIENQQSSLLDLLQRFIGCSQSGMNSLETRVQGLEMALDEISYDLAVSSGRIMKSNYDGNSCCKLPGTDFLSSRFWRRTETRYTSRLSSAGSIQTLGAMRSRPDKEANTETSKMDGEMLKHHNKGGHVMNPAADIGSEFRVNADVSSNTTEKKFQGDGNQRVFGNGMVDCATSVSLRQYKT